MLSSIPSHVRHKVAATAFRGDASLLLNSAVLLVVGGRLEAQSPPLPVTALCDVFSSCNSLFGASITHQFMAYQIKAK
jgi:hypothetical protein